MTKAVNGECDDDRQLSHFLPLIFIEVRIFLSNCLSLFVRGMSKMFIAQLCRRLITILIVVRILNNTCSFAATS